MRKIRILIMILAFILMIAGCKKSEANNTGKSNTSTDKTNSSEGKNTGVDVDQFSQPKKGDTVAEIVIRDFGSIYVKFFEEAAPKAVENFTTLAERGYYDGLSFHRILKDFMIQGGDPTGTGAGGESIWGESFEDEFADNLQPYRGALCMANAGPDTNGSQFFLVQAADPYDKATLDQIEVRYNIQFDEQAREVYGESGGTPWLYQLHTVFGQIYEGYEVLDQVAAVEMLDPRSGIPVKAVIIDTIKVSEFEG